MAKKVRDNRVPIMLTEEEHHAIDEWRHTRRISTRSDAIRRLIRNALWIEDEVAEISERADDIYDLLYQRYFELGELVHQFRDPDAPQPEISAVDALDRMVSWLDLMEEDLEILSTQTLSLNNRLVSVATAPHLKGAMQEHKREKEIAEQRRLDFIARRKEVDDNRRLFTAMKSMTDDERRHLDEMDDEAADRWLEARMAAVEVDYSKDAELPESIYAKRRKEKSNVGS